jgi:(1->4)-alpha-D-glucan 1-alpha-D-glucosylmutase
VDYATRRAALKSLQHRKIRIVNAALQMRRARPETFLAGSYHPVLAAGVAADHVIAFRRGDDVLVAATRWTVRLAETGWGDTVVAVPAGSWTDALTGRVLSGSVPAADLFTELPVALLERNDA